MFLLIFTFSVTLTKFLPKLNLLEPLVVYTRDVPAD